MAEMSNKHILPVRCYRCGTNGLEYYPAAQEQGHVWCSTCGADEVTLQEVINNQIATAARRAELLSKVAETARIEFDYIEDEDPQLWNMIEDLFRFGYTRIYRGEPTEVRRI